MSNPYVNRPHPAELKARLNATALHWVPRLLPSGRKVWRPGRQCEYRIGDPTGQAGRSCAIYLTGRYAGSWIDWKTGDRGDAFALIARVHGLDVRRDFKRVLELAAALIG